jgi:hypothetical protein
MEKGIYILERQLGIGLSICMSSTICCHCSAFLGRLSCWGISYEDGGIFYYILIVHIGVLWKGMISLDSRKAILVMDIFLLGIIGYHEVSGILVSMFSGA